MARANSMVPPEAIRIEDEVWQEAFARREPARINRRRPLRAIDGGQADWLLEQPQPIPTRQPAGDPAPHGSTARVPEPLTAAGAITATTSLPAPAGGTSARTNTAPPVRRTVKIQGRGAERNMPWPDASRRRPSRRAYERAGFRPDRLAMWAVMLGFLLVLVAIASGHG